MEVFNSAVLRTQSRNLCSGGGFDTRHNNHRLALWGLNLEIPMKMGRFGCLKSSVRMVSADPCGVGGCGFKEKGHVEYYDRSNASIRAEKKKEKKAVVGKEWSTISMKKRSKLLKVLEKNLSMFSEMGFGLEADQTKGEIISQAVEVLLQQLEHLRSEEKKSELRVREMDRPKSPKLKMFMEDSESESSSSSSESSDSECEGEMVNMSDLRTTTMGSIPQPSVVEGEETTQTTSQDIVVTSLNSMEATTCTTSSISFATVFNEANNRPSVEIEQQPLKKIQVCMGGKCKKAGALALVDEFSRVLGEGEGSVVTCKCMGKCKTAPNVKVFTGEEEMMGGDDSIRMPINPLCLGVGMEDVELIVANYFGNEATTTMQACIPSGLPPSVSVLKP